MACCRRVVVREGMSHAMAKDLCDSIEKVLRAFDEGDTVKGHDRPFNTVC